MSVAALQQSDSVEKGMELERDRRERSMEMPIRVPLSLVQSKRGPEISDPKFRK